jgi:RNA polymerase sigma-70 factor (ECF subfamily)
MQKVEKLAPWLARVLYRHFVDNVRSKQRSPLHLVTDDEINPNDCYEETLSPDNKTDVSLLQNRLQTALKQLNQDQRMLILLHDVEGYTFKEIHNLHNISIGTLKSRLNRARTRLRELLKNMEPFDAIQRVNK